MSSIIGTASLDQQLARANGRIENLTRKLARLKDGRHAKSKALTASIKQTEAAIKNWQRIAETVQYKIDQKSGGVK